MKLLIATNNKNKAREITEILGPYFDDIKTQKEAGIEIEVEEDGTTFQENAIKKAEETLKIAEGFDAVLSDDSGLKVDALGGAPGIYSARYSGEGHNDEKNKKKLLFELKDIPEEKRTARFACSIALARRNADTICVIDYVEGRISFEERGEKGFGYDPLFYYPPLQKTFAELEPDVKNSLSHRHNSLMRMKEEIEKL